MQIRKSIEITWKDIQIKGEIHTCFLANSGHQYITLKENDHTLEAVCWKNNKISQSKLTTGTVVILTGTLSTHPRNSKYQLIISKADLIDEQAILSQAIKELESKLRLAGLFDRKKPIKPYLQTIGIITSSDGAVLEDMKRQFERCTPVQILLYSVTVQGNTAVTEIITALQTLALRKVDAIIIARGGGSLNDLMPFNDEELVRAVASCPIPIISAIGHETDTPLCDYAADLRAPTPTAAPLLLLPLRHDELALINSFLSTAQATLEHTFRRSEEYLTYAQQYIRSASDSYTLHAQNLIYITSLATEKLLRTLDTPLPECTKPEIDFTWIQSILLHIETVNIFEKLDNFLMENITLIENYNPQLILRKGFAMIRVDTGYVMSAHNCKGAIEIIFHDGSVKVVVEATNK